MSNSPPKGPNDLSISEQISFKKSPGKLIDDTFIDQTYGPDSNFKKKLFDILINILDILAYVRVSIHKFLYVEHEMIVSITYEYNHDPEILREIDTYRLIFEEIYEYFFDIYKNLNNNDKISKKYDLLMLNDASKIIDKFCKNFENKNNPLTSNKSSYDRLIDFQKNLKNLKERLKKNNINILSDEKIKSIVLSKKSKVSCVIQGGKIKKNNIKKIKKNNIKKR